MELVYDGTNMWILEQRDVMTEPQQNKQLALQDQLDNLKRHNGHILIALPGYKHHCKQIL